eukprot:1643068-Pleurochrysis_carterae.AAC.1
MASDSEGLGGLDGIQRRLCRARRARIGNRTIRCLRSWSMAISKGTAGDDECADAGARAAGSAYFLEGMLVCASQSLQVESDNK